MNEQFKINDAVILQNAVFYAHLNETRATVSGALQKRRSRDPRTGRFITVMAYQIDVMLPNGRGVLAMPHQLRRPQSDKEWAEGKVREITQPQESVHVGGGAKHLIPEEA